VTRYRTIVADPPWDYGRDAERWVPTDGNQADRRAIPYPAMTVDQIATLPVTDWAADSARLFLWTTNRYLRDAFIVAHAWGFEYRQILVWHKLGAAPWGGSIAPISAEFLLAFVRGDPPVLARWSTSVVAVARAAHSAKPDVFLDLVEHVSPPRSLPRAVRPPRPLRLELLGRPVARYG
jgi:N6-adenosine-specific RNA methylase IME4